MTHPTWQERFDREFPSPDGHDFIGMERISYLKSFIEAELKEARKEVVERIVKEIDEMEHTNIEFFGRKEKI